MHTAQGGAAAETSRRRGGDSRMLIVQGPRRRGAEALLSVRGPRREARLSASARLGLTDLKRVGKEGWPTSWRRYSGKDMTDSFQNIE